MEAHTVTGERQRVRREGEEYLARYPRGPYRLPARFAD